tara:strand:- start:1968 stop:2330 length:363 start_codon:yes stop_codon:yes gene_type:complete
MYKTYRLTDHNEIVGLVISDDDPAGILIDRPMKLLRDYVGSVMEFQLDRYLSLDDGTACFIHKRAIIAEAVCHQKVVDYYEKVVDKYYMVLYEESLPREEKAQLTDEERFLLLTGKMKFQ